MHFVSSLCPKSLLERPLLGAFLSETASVFELPRGSAQSLLNSIGLHRTVALWTARELL